MNFLRTVLNQSYPFYYRGKDLIILNCIIFIMSLFFNYFFQPFNVHVPEHKMDYFWISLIHSLTGPIIITVLALLLFRIVPAQDEKWNLGKEIGFISLFLLLVGIGQFLLRDLIYDNPNNWSWRYFYEEIRNTFMVGTLLVTVLISINYNRLLYKNSRNAQAIRPAIASTLLKETSAALSIETQVKSDDFLLDIDQFIYAKAERNYIEIHFQNESGLHKLVKRITITKLESQMLHCPQIIKSHRSYLVNLYQVKKVSGNAQGYRLSLKDSPTTIPVSRNMIPHFKEKMEQI